MDATAHRRTALGIAAALALLGAGMTSAGAQDRPGRFTMSPIDGGFVRLDTETGAMALCRALPGHAAGAGAWNCQPMGDTAAETQGRLGKIEGENKELRAEVKRLEDLLGLNGERPKSEGPQAEQRPGGRSGGLGLPSEEDVDKAVSYMERMVKKLQEAMKRLEGIDSRKGTPL